MRCPFCQEEIQAGAAKCRYCNEWLDDRIGRMQSDISDLKDAEFRRQQARRERAYYVVPILILSFLVRLWAIDQIYNRDHPSYSVVSEPFPQPGYNSSPPPSLSSFTTGISANVPFNTPEPITLIGPLYSGSSASYTVETDPSHGRLSGSAPNLVYTPKPGYSGPDSFHFSSFNNGISNPGIVSIRVLSSSPKALPKSYRTLMDTSLKVDAAHGLLRNNGANILPIKAAASDDYLDRAVVRPDGSFVFTPPSGYRGNLTFSYLITDGKGNPSHPAQVSVFVDNAPVAKNASVTVAQGYSTNVCFDASDEIIESLGYSIASWPAHGALSNISDGNLVYTPKPSFSGQDSFTFKASNSVATSLPAKISITVTPTPAVAAAGHYYLTAQKSALTVNTALGVLSGTTGTAPPFTAVIVMQPEFGKLTLGTHGDFVFTPRPGFAGRDGFTYKVLDSTRLESAPALAVIDVEGAPQVADNQALTGEPGKPLPLRLVAYDPCRAPLTYKIVSRPKHGNLRGAGPNLTYWPAPGYCGLDSVSWVASNSLKTSATVTMTILVQRTLPTVEPFHLTLKSTQPSAVAMAGGEGLTVPAQFGQIGTYLLNFANSGSRPADFLFHGPASSDGYAFAYFNAPAGGGDITAQVTSPAGWVTPAVLPGKSISIRSQITVTDAAWHDSLFTFNASAPNGKNVRTAELKFTLPQHIAKVCYSYDSGQHWSDVPPSGVIPIGDHCCLTLKAFRSNPNQPWPGSFDLLNWWDTTCTTTSSEGPNTDFFGDQVTFEYTTLTPASLNDVTRRNELKVVGGNTIHLYPVVYPDVTLALESRIDASTGIDPGNHSTSVIGSVTDADGQPVTGTRLNFTTTAGTFAETGKSTASCNTDSQGKANVTLVAGPTKEQATVTAQVNDAPKGALTQTTAVGLR